MEGRRPLGGSAAAVIRAPLAVLLAAVVLAGCGFQEPAILPITTEPLTQIAVPPITGKTADMDIFQIDQARHRLYTADLTDEGIDVFDISGPVAKYMSTIDVGAIPNGVVMAPDLKRMFSGNDDGTVAVVDLDDASPTVNTIVKAIPTGGQGVADLIDYDPKDHLVVVTNPDDGFVTLIDGRSLAILGRISGLQVVDQPRYDPANGLIYVSGTDANAVYVIDPRTRKLVSTVAIPVPCEPHGMAINPATNQGLIGCGYKEQPLTLAWDFARNSMIRTFDQAGAGDAVIYDAVSNHFYFAASSYAPAEMAVFTGGSPITFLTAVPTSHKSHTVGYDEVHGTLYTFDGLHRQAGLWSFPDPLPTARKAN